ncbi:hypothetical protein [Polyangium aurulentum]|uniref:hypothetical protein n=1 Tax=Polyangium aurulentum TaxID=2567896 RepID=UPI001F4727CA|nr:hypothetical protein [Polyangium aurulentum]
MRREDDRGANPCQGVGEGIGSRRDEVLLALCNGLGRDRMVPAQGIGERKDDLLGRKIEWLTRSLKEGEVGEDERLIERRFCAREVTGRAREVRDDVATERAASDVAHLLDHTLKRPIAQDIVAAQRMAKVGAVDAEANTAQIGVEDLIGLEKREPAIVEARKLRTPHGRIAMRDRRRQKVLGARRGPDDDTLPSAIRLDE